MAKRVEGRSDKLLECAKEEFLEMGFQEASLRVIAAKADTTTGSIYTRFLDKEGLFHALVDDTMEELIRWFRDRQAQFDDRSAEQKKEDVLTYKPELWEMLVDYIYDHWDVFRLLVRCADIDCYENLLHRMIEIETDYTYRFMESTGNDAIKSGRLSPMMIHILGNAFYSGVFEIVRHEMKKAEAVLYVRQLRRFFLLGWADILETSPD